MSHAYQTQWCTTDGPHPTPVLTRGYQAAVRRTVSDRCLAREAARQNWCRVTQPTNGANAEAMAARYGRPSAARRRVGFAVIALGVAALLAWVVWAALGQSGNNVGGLVESFDVRSPHEVSVTVQITRTSTDAVHCTISAMASDHAEVGQRVVRLPAGSSGTRTITTVVRTEREATTADVVDCG